MDMNLMMKRGKLLRKSVTNLLHHHHNHRHMTRGNYGIQDYEFSCSNSPNPVFFHVSKRKHHHYFPCINIPDVVEEEEEDEENNKAVMVMLPKNSPDNTFNYFHSDQFASGEKRSPSPSPFSVRVSNYSSEEEIVDSGNGGQVDHEAEEFIRRFYEQLRLQSRMQLLQYQDMN
ncbi:hypothetical protein JCGZ_26907 [Jatropha curcas]|uniref:Uncharacterized protein n=1 Tax=Jatropha curcas TaxID=180498 RepID=A0A067LCR2_JATCU|nr:hypothetical protein JCGZ_26907 [Jatropha curcas]